MPVNLSLLVLSEVNQFNEIGVAYPQSTFEMHQDYAVFGQLMDLSVYRKEGRKDIPKRPTIPTEFVPPGFQVWLYHKGVHGPARMDEFGNRLTFVWARDLKMLKLRKNGCDVNCAIRATIKTLPGDTPIVLYWHK